MGMPYFQTKPWMMFTWLVGGLEHEFHFSIQLGILTPADELIFFRGWLNHQPDDVKTWSCLIPRFPSFNLPGGFHKMNSR
jgi:uncharacterized membrane protein YedE/YeeE